MFRKVLDCLMFDKKSYDRNKKIKIGGISKEFVIHYHRTNAG